MADNLADIREWKSGLPACSVWACESGSFDPTWQVEHIKAGRRILPSQFVPNYDAYDATGGTSCLRPRQIEKWIDPHAEALKWISDQQLPLCLRTNNICDAFTRSPRYRGGDFAAQPIVYRRLADGTLDQARICDPLGPTEPWAEEGKLWATSPWVKRIGELCPSPAWLMFVENNEGAYDSPLRSVNNVRVYVDAAGNWLPNLESQSVRLAEWMPFHPPRPSPAYVASWFSLMRRDKYHSLYEAFRESSPWPQAEWRTAAFKGGPHPLIAPIPPVDVEESGYAPDGLAYDAGSPGQYITSQNGDLTSVHWWSQVSNLIPAWEWSEKRNANSWREISVSINAAGAVAGAAASSHEVVVPAVWEGFIQSLLWQMQKPGTPALLRHWIGSSTKPTDPFDNRATPDPRLSGLTHADYVLAVCRSVDHICEHPVLREFYRFGRPVVVSGAPSHPTDAYRAKFAPGTRYPREGDADNRWRVLDCDVNTPRAEWKWGRKGADGKDLNEINGTNKVWATATELNGRWLLYAFTPCKLGRVTVTIPNAGSVEIDFAGQPFGYWFCEPAGIRAKRLEVE